MRMNKKFRKTIAILLILAFLLLPIGALATTMEPPTIEMEDVTPEDWFYRYVVAGLRFEILTGVSGETFRFVPDRLVTRAEFITMLGRLHEYGHGTIGTPGEGPFYQRYLEWAVEMGIMHGNQHGDLMPRSLVNREQMAVVVYRYIDVFDLWDYFEYLYPIVSAPFSDFYEMSYWARWIVEELRYKRMAFTSYEGRRFAPKNSFCRAIALHLAIRNEAAGDDLVQPMPR